MAYLEESLQSSYLMFCYSCCCCCFNEILIESSRDHHARAGEAEYRVNTGPPPNTAWPLSPPQLWKLKCVSLFVSQFTATLLIELANVVLWFYISCRAHNVTRSNLTGSCYRVKLDVFFLHTHTAQGHSMSSAITPTT